MVNHVFGSILIALVKVKVSCVVMRSRFIARFGLGLIPMAALEEDVFMHPRLGWRLIVSSQPIHEIASTSCLIGAKAIIEVASFVSTFIYLQLDA
ncbi:hypothetical protein RIF29_18888 [Crotalaria pallida]|uniref:Secreted protein n=1 Tax=Crotalaria pallida TaxID=3830 RepID=A0AAN9IAW7_CROPI